MASTLIVLIAVLAACQASPIWFVDNGFAPNTLFIRQGRSPDFLEPKIAYGFGSAFSADIGGIRHSSSNGASFQTGGAEAYGAGIARSDGIPYVSGVGYANANPQQVYRTNYPYAYSPYNGLRRDYTNNLGTAASTAQSHSNFGSTIALSRNSPYSSSATSSAQNQGYNGLSTAISHSDSYGNAISYAKDGSNSAVAATLGGSGGAHSSAQALPQQRGGAIQNSFATAYNVPGYQNTQSHASTY